MSYSIVSFSSSEQAKIISTQYLRDEHVLIDNFILIDNLGLAAVQLSAELESFLFEILSSTSNFSTPLTCSLTCSHSL